jgi:hypothetical protein
MPFSDSQNIERFGQTPQETAEYLQETCGPFPEGHVLALRPEEGGVMGEDGVTLFVGKSDDRVVPGDS